MFTPFRGRCDHGADGNVPLSRLAAGWQFTIAQVFKSSAADEGYFRKSSRVTKVDAPVQGMLIIVIIQTGLSLMTISPSLNSQFNAR